MANRYKIPNLDVNFEKQLALTNKRSYNDDVYGQKRRKWDLVRLNQIIIKAKRG